MKTIRGSVISGVLIFLSIVLLVAFAWVFWQVRTILLYILIAAIITVLTRPIEKRMRSVKIRNKPIPSGLRAVIVLLSLYVLIFSVFPVFIHMFAGEALTISHVSSDQLQMALHAPINQLQNTFTDLQQTSGSTQSLESYIQSAASDMLKTIQFTSVVNGVVSFFGSAFIAFFAISFFTFFFIKDGVSIFEMLLLLVPVKHVHSVRNIITDSEIMLRKYFTGVLLDVLFVTSFISIGMAVLGVKNFLLIGFFAGIMNIIPYIGPLIGGAFAIVIAVSSNLTLDFYSALIPLIEKIILVFIAMNLLDAFIVQPFIFSKRVKAHPIEIFTVILIAGSLAGIRGMIVAVPVYTILRIIAREFFSKYRFVQRLTDELDATPDQNPIAKE
ncbi:MAG: AI-2E family transporter [Bacteroidetes bacterium]|nr:AI-2E family transporter [Bacteroidota bacterium]